MTFDFNYYINAGRLGAENYYGDKKGGDATLYLENIFGIEREDYYNFSNPHKIDDYTNLAESWNETFSEPLFFSQGAYLLENDGIDQIGKLLYGPGTLDFDANKKLSRVEVYEEAFKLSFYGVHGEASSSSNYTSPDVETETGIYMLDSYDNSILADCDDDDSTVDTQINVLDANFSGNLDQGKINELTALYEKLEEEAALLGPTLVNDSIVVGGAPELPYSSLDSEIYLLQKEMHRELDDFLRMYDDLLAFMNYEMQDNVEGTWITRTLTDPDGTSSTYEQAVHLGAKRTAQIALTYAERYFGAGVGEKPTYDDYMFTNSHMYYANATIEKDIFTKLDYYNFMENTDSGSNLPSATDTGADDYEVANLISGLLDNENKANEFSGDLADKHEEAVMSFMRDDLFAVDGITTDIKIKDSNEFAHYLGTAMFQSAEKLVDLKMQIVEKTLVSSINNEVRAEYEARVGAMNAINSIITNYNDGCTTGIDPYLVNIQGAEYIIGKDSDLDGEISSMLEILGVNDTKDDLFRSVIDLDADGDGFVSQEEMAAKNIIFQAVDENGQLTDKTFSTESIRGIDLSTFEAADGTDNVFGRFKVDLADSRADAKQTFESKSYFNNLFGKEVDFSILDQQESLDVEQVTEIPAVVEESSEQDGSIMENILKSFSFDLGTSAQDTSMTSLLEELCWQMGVTTLTETQKLNILDSIDDSQPLDIIESKIQQQLDAVNLSA